MTETALATREDRAPVPYTDRGFDPTDIEGLWRIAGMYVRAGLAPKGLDTAEAICVAAAHGKEIGLSFMQSIQSIAVINGRPSIYGDSALALVRGSGLLEDFHEEIRGDGDSRVAACMSKRKGMARPRVTEFSVADAKRAGVWGKAGPWSQYPERMLMWRARGFNLRDQFGDVLKGLITTEEAMDTPSVRIVENEALPDGRSSFGFKKPPPEPSAAPAETEPDKPKRGRTRKQDSASPISAGAAEEAEDGKSQDGTPPASPPPAEPESPPSPERAATIERLQAEWGAKSGATPTVTAKALTLYFRATHNISPHSAHPASVLDVMRKIKSGDIDFAFYEGKVNQGG